jgi:hypothetical protein
MRELKRHKNFSLIAIHFSISDDELIWIRFYNQQPVEILAKEAIQYVKENNCQMGLEVIIFSKIKPPQIKKTYKSNKVVGWRYYPDSHGDKPVPYLQRGEPFGNRINRN